MGTVCTAERLGMNSEQHTEWHSRDGSVTITLNELLNCARAVSVTSMPLDALQECVLDWQGDPEEWARVNSVDMRDPILVLVVDGCVERIIDGNHRVQRARQLGWHEIRARAIELKRLPREYTQVFGW